MKSLGVLSILLFASEALKLPESRLSCARMVKRFNEIDSPTSSSRTRSSSSNIALLSDSGYYGEEKSGLSLKVIFTIVILGVGLYGSSISGIFKATEDTLINQQRSSKVAKSTKGSSEDRGSMTHLTKREINEKLSAIPVFYVSPAKSEAVLINNGVGYFFAEKADTDDFVSSLKVKNSDVEVKATTLDDVFYTLIEKKTKLGTKFISGVSASSDPSAVYRLKGPSSQIANTAADWRETHPYDFPLFRVPKLAFNSDGGFRVPLFLRKEDAVNSFDRLQEAAESKGAKRSEIPDMQITSLLDLVERFETGGFEGRTLEFYPSIDVIEQARAMIDSREY